MWDSKVTDVKRNGIGKQVDTLSDKLKKRKRTQNQNFEQIQEETK